MYIFAIHLAVNYHEDDNKTVRIWITWNKHLSWHFYHLRWTFLSLGKSNQLRWRLVSLGNLHQLRWTFLSPGKLIHLKSDQYKIDRSQDEIHQSLNHIIQPKVSLIGVAQIILVCWVIFYDSGQDQKIIWIHTFNLHPAYSLDCWRCQTKQASPFISNSKSSPLIMISMNS